LPNEPKEGPERFFRESEVQLPSSALTKRFDSTDKWSSSVSVIIEEGTTTIGGAESDMALDLVA
jgi:hypothetical protein